MNNLARTHALIQTALESRAELRVRLISMSGSARKYILTCEWPGLAHDSVAADGETLEAAFDNLDAALAEDMRRTHPIGPQI